MIFNSKRIDWPTNVINWLAYRYIDNSDLAPQWKWWFAWRPVRLDYPDDNKIAWLELVLRLDKTNQFGIFNKLRYYKLPKQQPK